MPSAVLEALANRYRMSVTKVLRVEAPAPSQDNPTSPGRAAVRAPHTAPYHRVADEASVELRLRALLNLLVNRGLLDEDAYHEEVRRLMKDAARVGSGRERLNPYPYAPHGGAGRESGRQLHSAPTACRRGAALITLR